MNNSEIMAHLKELMPSACAYVRQKNPESPPSEIRGVVTIAVQQRISLAKANVCERCDIQTCRVRVLRPNLGTRQR